MKSIKPGRGPSAMGAAGSVAVGIFGVIWTFGAAGMGAPPFFILFGVVFVGIAVVQGIYHFKNATGENRMSVFDITDSQAEPDPLEQWVKRKKVDSSEHTSQVQTKNEMNFCPYCGSNVTDQAYVFCASCGKELRK